MTTELKVTASDERVAWLRENFKGISDADRMRSMFTLMEYLLDESRPQPDFEDVFTDAALATFDPEEVATEALKRAILESDEVDLSDLSTLAVSDDPDNADTNDANGDES